MECAQNCVLANFRAWQAAGKPVKRILSQKQKQELQEQEEKKQADQQRAQEEQQQKEAAEREVRLKEDMERAIEVCHSLVFSIAKLSLYAASISPLAQSPGYADRLMKRDELQSVLFETLSVHPVVLYLTDASAAASYQTGLGDFLQPRLVPFLDEPPAAIGKEVDRAALAFMQREQERAKNDDALRQRMEATEKHIALLRASAAKATRAAAAPSAASASPKSVESDWSTRFKKASAVYDGLKMVLRVLPI
jgi:hypothetical protein